ncbi:hypothetical protein [Candidatus Tisiphia endosymbiont of Oplodontha viridula]|uniref:hypothetical protein n=1 Tax=Candidatus Tisiphia endosymbiont of Oplodontha viridula TaxID=3077925 RepID=UPI0035C8E89E
MFILVLGYKNEQPSSRATKWRGDPNEQRAVATFGLLRRRLKWLLAMTASTPSKPINGLRPHMTVVRSYNLALI